MDKKKIYIYAGLTIFVLILVYLLINKFENWFGKSQETKEAEKTIETNFQKTWFVPYWWQKIAKSKKVKGFDLTKTKFYPTLFRSLDIPQQIAYDFDSALHPLKYVTLGVGTDISTFWNALKRIENKIQFNQVLSAYTGFGDLISDINNDLSPDQIKQFYSIINKLPNGF